MQITLNANKDTANTRRFAARSGDLDLTVYVQKSNDLASQDTLTLTVEDSTATVEGSAS